MLVFFIMKHWADKEIFCGRGGGENPLLSIVVPVYNVEKYLSECLESLINQTLKNIEIIIVNDASPDGSEAIILEYAARDNRIVYIRHEENKRQGAARNTGIRAARGEYIAFVDSDDYVDTRLYEAGVRAFERHNVDIIMFSHCRFDENEKSKASVLPFYGNKKISADEYALKLNLFFVIACNKIYRLAHLRENNIFFPENIYFEDYSFWVHYCLAVQPKARCLSSAHGCYYYRANEGSVTANRAKNCIVLPRIFFIVYQHLQNFNKSDTLFEAFYNWLSGVTESDWKAMGDEERKEYALAYKDFFSKISLSEEQKMAFPEFGVFSALPKADIKAQMYFIELCNQKFKMKLDCRYRFGASSWRDKLKKLCRFARRSAACVLGLRHM